MRKINRFYHVPHKPGSYAEFNPTYILLFPFVAKEILTILARRENELFELFSLVHELLVAAERVADPDLETNKKRILEYFTLYVVKSLEYAIFRTKGYFVRTKK